MNAVHILWLMAAVAALVGAACAARPGPLSAWLQTLPRDRRAGAVLLGIDLFWVAWIVLHAHLGRFEALRPLVYVLAPAGFAAILFLMDELLTARAFGGLLLLAANPVLMSIRQARWSGGTDGALVVTVLAYVWVVAGIAFVLSPYLFRDALRRLAGTASRCRAAGLVHLGGAVVLAALAVALRDAV